MDDTRSGIRSIDRALMILNRLADSPDGTTLSSLASELGLPPSTCHRILTTLEDRGFVHRWADRGRYSLGYRVYELVAHSGSLEGFAVASARDTMARLNERLSETCNLARREGLMARYIAQVSTNAPVGLFTRIGSAVPLHATGVGKVLLSDVPDPVLKAVTRDMRSYTTTTITDVATLLEAIDTIRIDGYAIDDQEYQEGIVCVAVPVFDFTGHIHAALSVAGPANRISRRLSDVVLATMEAAEEISNRLGIVSAEPDSLADR